MCIRDRKNGGNHGLQRGPPHGQTPDENKIIEAQCGVVRRVRRKIMPHKIFVLDVGERDLVCDRERNLSRITMHTREGERAKEERREVTNMENR